MSTLAVHAEQPVTGVPLVLLHAFPLDSGMWDEVARRLDGVPVVRIDAPGFGSTPPRSEAGLEAFALDVVAAIRELGAEQAVLAGLSMGGYVAMAVAEEAPGALAGLALLSTKASADPEPARAARLEMVAAVERGEPEPAAGMLEKLLGATTLRERPDVVDRVRRALAAAPGEGLVWAQRSMAQRPDRLAALAALPEELPALVARGAEDGLMSPEDADAMADALGTDVVEVARAGHLLALEDPATVAAALADLHRRATA
ncbi:MAG TPA: alpha/beta hydrolase [Actinotalea caeni]|uniref:alpha/beta fold hydrolase n=1 Tax=Actinotalea caeni TaxID=1348467 RepID=UPI0012E23191|nr:alpha/beta hydrolase [Actinotalea caeni]HLV57232.1 alpha/beta hydrolase [Actinotalea caeni]